MSDEMDIFKDQYDQELALIKANGNDRAALKLRYEQYCIHDQELLEYVKRRTIEQAGRKAALEDMVSKIVGGK